MKALVFDGTLKLVGDYPKPRPARDEALIRVMLAGICNTDIEIVKGYMGFKGVPGHEFVGVVEECDDAMYVGRRVVGEINVPCGDCPTCAAGLGNHCPDRTVLGIDGRDGAFAEYLLLPVSNLKIVPESIADEEAVFVEPLAAACQVLEQTTVRSGDSVCVLGSGKLGLLVVQVLEPLAASTTLVGRSGDNLDLVGSADLERVPLDDLERAARFDLVVDCTGSPRGFPLAMKLVKPRGTIVLKTTAAEGHPLNLAPVVINEITVIGSRCGPFDDALRLLRSRSMNVTPLISARFPLDRGVEAFEAARKQGALKVLLEIP